MKLQILAALTALSLTAPFAQAHEFKAGELMIDHPMAFETTEMSKSGAGYLTITNNGDSPDRLIEVRADFPKVSIHKSEESDGVMRMTPVEAIDVPAGETVTLAPGGLHVMFMGLTEPLEAGTEIPATLVFEGAGDVDVVFNVEERTGEEMDHSQHGDHSSNDMSN